MLAVYETKRRVEEEILAGGIVAAKGTMQNKARVTVKGNPSTRGMGL